MRGWSLLALLLSACTTTSNPSRAAADHLFVSAGDAGTRTNDFLAVVDVNPASPTYAKVVATAPTGVGRTAAHHTEHQMPAGEIPFANGFRERVDADPDSHGADRPAEWSPRA